MIQLKKKIDSLDNEDKFQFFFSSKLHDHMNPKKLHSETYTQVMCPHVYTYE